MGGCHIRGLRTGPRGADGIRGVSEESGAPQAALVFGRRRCLFRLVSVFLQAFPKRLAVS